MALEDIQLLLCRPEDLVIASGRLIGLVLQGEMVTASTEPGKMASILDVAKLAEVSTGTVSRVINDHPSVRP